MRGRRLLDQGEGSVLCSTSLWLLAERPEPWPSGASGSLPLSASVPACTAVPWVRQADSVSPVVPTQPPPAHAVPAPPALQPCQDSVSASPKVSVS